MPKWFKFLIFEDVIGNEIKQLTNVYHRWIKSNKVVYSVGDEINVKYLQVKYKKPVLYYETEFYRFVVVYDKELTSIPFEPIEGNKLLIGNSLDGICSIKINTEMNHVLLGGCTGSGKSSLAKVMITNLILNEIEVLIHDNKSSDDYDIFKRHCKLTKGVEEFETFLNQVETRCHKRMSGKESKSPLIIIIDEIFALKLEKSKAKLYDRLALLLSTARSANIHFVIISQRMTTEILPSSITTHCSIRVCLQSSTKQESQNTIYSDNAYFINNKGRGYLSINGRLTLIQSFYLTDSEIDKLLPIVCDNLEQTVKQTVKNYIIGDDLHEINGER